MAKINTTFTSESVCAGHPDKICDQISDAILDAVLAKDKNGRVAVETLVTKNKIILAGEVRTSEKINYKKIARDEIKRLGYTNERSGFWYKSNIEVYIQKQSSEIAQGVDKDGAGDQGMMFGYACKQTPELMPAPILIAHKLAEQIDKVRGKKLNYLRPDGKTQITLEYKNNIPYLAKHLVIAVPHSEDITATKLKNDLLNFVINPVLEDYKIKFNTKNLVINGTGVWHNGGPAADTGLTGRKIIVDTYGGYAKVGGGAFSGKDPTKVDRSGAYAARFIAKNIVANKLADEAEVRLAYFIGAKKPVMQEIETFGTNEKPQKVINDFTKKLINTSVKGIIETLDLKRPIYKQTAAYGHFGRDIFPWEKVT